MSDGNIQKKGFSSPAWWDVFQMLPADFSVMTIGQRQELSKAIVEKLQSRRISAMCRDGGHFPCKDYAYQPGSCACDCHFEESNIGKVCHERV